MNWKWMNAKWDLDCWPVSSWHDSHAHRDGICCPVWLLSNRCRRVERRLTLLLHYVHSGAPSYISSYLHIYYSVVCSKRTPKLHDWLTLRENGWRSIQIIYLSWIHQCKILHSKSYLSKSIKKSAKCTSSIQSKRIGSTEKCISITHILYC